MEAFEQFVRASLESEGLVVSSSVKFPVRRRVNKAERVEHQTHGYEVDLVGARRDRLVLASVKSFFGSRGVLAEDVRGTGKNAKRYTLLNNQEIRNEVVAAAARLYGYTAEQVRLRFYVGRFAKGSGPAVREWCKQQQVGGGSIEVIGLRAVVANVRAIAAKGTYVNDAVVVTMKVLAEANLLDLKGTPTAEDGESD